MNDDLAAGKFARPIVLGPHRSPAVHPLVPGPSISRYHIGNVLLTVVQNQQLSLRVVLTQEIFDGLWCKCTAIGSWHDARDEWLTPDYQRRCDGHRRFRRIGWSIAGNSVHSRG